MDMDGVQLTLTRTVMGDQVQIAAHVSSSQSQPLTWRLVVRANGPSGTSQVSQGGKTDGKDRVPVGTLWLNADAVGVAVLIVENPQGESVTRDLQLVPDGRP